MGVNIRGDAVLQRPNLATFEAETNDVLLFNYDGTWHVGVIVHTSIEGWIIKETNYKRCKETTRFIAKNDEALVGAIRVPLSTATP